MNDDELRAELDAAGAEYAKAEEARKAALDRVRAALLAAEGTVDIKEMARRTNISRPTAYRLLRRAE
jgi:transcriptional regulator of acetoin/glycerol metabolism